MAEVSKINCKKLVSVTENLNKSKGQLAVHYQLSAFSSQVLNGRLVVYKRY